MVKNLVCLFSKNHYDRRGFDLIRSTSDNAIYEAATNDLDNCDIYVLDEFAMDFNDNLPYASPENFYIVFISVDSSEVEQWKK